MTKKMPETKVWKHGNGNRFTTKFITQSKSQFESKAAQKNTLIFLISVYLLFLIIKYSAIM